MTQFQIQKFNIPRLKGISEKTIEEHLKLYAGYVKNANMILDILSSKTTTEQDTYTHNELQRRFSFEFNGIRNHEIYFESISEGAHAPNPQSLLYQTLEKAYGGFDAWLTRFSNLALTRGIGWAMCVYDPISKELFHAWIDEQHLGQLNGCIPIIALDMWEHSYVADYAPSGKKTYVADYISALNWTLIEERFLKVVQK